MPRRTCLLAALVTAGCASESPRSNGAEVRATATARTARIVQRDVEVLAGPVLRSEGAFRPASAALVSDVRGGSGHETLHVAPLLDPAFWIESTPLDAPAARVDGSPSLDGFVGEREDRLYAHGTTVSEEFRVLRVAATEVRWSLRTSEGASIVLAGGGLEVRDARGLVRLRALPPWAVDARKVRVDLSFALDGNILSAKLPEGLEAPIVVDPAWTAFTPKLGSARQWITAIDVSRPGLVGDDVIFAGGSTLTSTATDKADLLTGGAFKPKDLPSARDRATAVSLGGGNALFIGGRDATNLPTSAVARFDSTGQAWSSVAAMAATRAGNAAVVLSAGGGVLTSGGLNDTSAAQSTAEIFNGTAWVTTGSMSEVRASHTLNVLASGKVLAVGGGENGTGSSTAELYDPVSKTWTATASMTTSRAEHTTTVLADGRVLVVGGRLGKVRHKTTEIWDPTTGKWTAGADMATPRAGHFSVTLPSGMILAAGGGIASAEVYEQKTGVWLAAGSMSIARVAPGVALARSGKTYFAGGGEGVSSGSPMRDDVEIFQQLNKGQSCTLPGECTTGFCVDGVCCDGACGGPCETCTPKGSIPGTCTPLPDKSTPLPGHPTCGAFRFCGPGACATTCAADGDCADGNYCEGTTCVPKKASGTACKESRSCTSAHCADGVCCDKACAGPCESCAQAGKSGTCSPAPDGPPPEGHPTCTPYLCRAGACGSACTVNEDCASGNLCKEAKCVPATATCSADKLSSIPPKGSPVSCNGFLCKPNGDCATTCTSSDNCAPGFVCDATVCTKPAATATASDGGCTAGAGSGNDSVLLVLAAAAMVWGRRRSARGRQPTAR